MRFPILRLTDTGNLASLDPKSFDSAVMSKVTQAGNRVVVTKAGFTFAAWVEVDGVAVPLYGLTDTPEGPEVWILSQERRKYVVGYAVKTEPEYIAPDSAYKDMMICCIIDGTGGKSETSVNEEDLRSQDGDAGSFIGRDLPGRRTQHFMFSKPALTYVPTLEYTPTILGRLGTIEVSFQRSKPAQRIGKGKSKKEGPTFAPINETMAKQSEVETLTRYGHVEPSDRPRFIIPPIFKPDVPNLVSVMFRYVSKEKLQTLGFLPEDSAVKDIVPKVEENPALDRVARLEERRTAEKRQRVDDSEDEKPLIGGPRRKAVKKEAV